ncbi:FtsK/SpoIIIE domain-containing protein [Microbacterium sp. ARD32]|uniref:FtsK/SpoIIIE domain-containing protein n=1 Tax=Microbacterium sp. ARD32 TaxID=2962577 RepID=UPI002881388A|nr:FtsK/SpoIIIE domain-containing protein [Microbacterium sp. ARD32]MDT0156882.1 FtsK/SpoIIIE domain-containing protein [Microbacterium sp. ARD32]
MARAIVTQLCLRFGPSQLMIAGEALPRWSLESMPHAGRQRSAFRLAVGESEERADAVVCVRGPGEEPPEGVTTVLDCVDPSRGRIRTPDGDEELAIEALSAQQAILIGERLAARTEGEATLPDRVGFDELRTAAPDGLSAPLGRGERGEATVDLVADGPHAIVTGMTGTGKSELLISWVTGLAAAHPPEELAFVLVDFKGGSAFDPLRRLPHVVAVITDLDADGSRRGVGSLTAELRRREGVLADAGARDVADCPGLGRLVIVVDEFAALLQEHPDLGAIFTDVAARERALGMHLVLATQRASGIIRDALAANCPLRISLRVAESADSRFVIGSDDAAALPGGPDSRGLAFVRRPRDADAAAVRVALTQDADIAGVQRAWERREPQRSPWLPPLPARLALPSGAVRQEVELRSTRHGVAEVTIGLADEPERQRQPWVRLGAADGLSIIGGPRSGKSSAVAMLAQQLSDAVIVPGDPEAAWDAVERLSAGFRGTVLCDDLDVLTAQYPPEHAQLFLSRWESIVRAPGRVVVTMSRVSGPVGRLIDALPRRALLRLTSKVEHIAAGGDPGAFDRERPDGRALLDGREVQLCAPDVAGRDPVAVEQNEPWRPSAVRTGVITSAVDAARAVLARAHPGHRLVPPAEAADVPAEAPAVIVGDPEEWRSQWALLQGIRSGGELVVAAECASELRQLAGVRELPPYARLHADRAWSVIGGRMPRRVLLG